MAARSSSLMVKKTIILNHSDVHVIVLDHLSMPTLVKLRQSKLILSSYQSFISPIVSSSHSI